MAKPAQQLQGNSDNSQSPYQPEQCPTPSSVQDSQSERRVGSSNEQVNHRVIDHVENPFQGRGFQGVIERGGEVKQDHGQREDGTTDYVASFTMTRSMHNEEWRTNNSCEQSDSMADAIGEFFFASLFASRC